MVRTDNVATSYFQTQKKLTPKQARWQEFLAEFDYKLEYKPGITNRVADALSRKAELAAMSQPETNLKERILEGLEKDSNAQSLMEFARSGKTRRFWIRDGLLVTKGNRVFVPKWGNLRRDVLKESHDSRWAGHPGMHRTMVLMEDS